MMKNIRLLLLLFTGILHGQIVDIPDANFKAKLIGSSLFHATDFNGNYITVDANGDGEIQVNEALNVQTLNVGSSNITDLTGIENFTNLRSLFINSNSITTIDLSSLPNLNILNCTYNNFTSLTFPLLPNLHELSTAGNPLTSLDISNLPNLTYLYCRDSDLSSLIFSTSNSLTTLNATNNELTTIDTTHLTQLRELGCAQNLLTSLDVSNLTQIESLGCSYNFLTELNLSNLENLVYLYCEYNQITTLDVSNNILLNDFWCYNNPITTLDVSDLTVLNRLLCSNCPQLTSLFLKNGKFETGLNLTGCTNLQYVCADEMQLEYVQNQFITHGLVNATVNSYCSFIPGGDYNTIIGNLLFDYNNNGCDVNDYTYPYIKLKMNDGTNSTITFTNASGNYNFYTLDGDYTITPKIEQPAYFNISPPNATINFPSLDNVSQTQNFCIAPNSFHPDLEVVITPIGVARPGFDTTYKIIYKNKGNQPLNGQVTLTFDGARTDFVTANPSISTQTGNSLLWNFSNLFPFETRVIDLTLNVNSPLENPAVNNGDILDFEAHINLFEGDETPEDNSFELSQTVVNSYDPNDKTCLEGNTITPNEIGKYVHYNINFENLGTADAVNVVVRDIIDTTKFDIDSLQLLYASHPVQTRIIGNLVEFIFENINLPPSSIQPIGGHGNVLFKIKTKATLVVGDQIANTANIFFDYNAPIATNEARTSITSLSNSTFIEDKNITVAPNPATNSITVTSKSNIKSLLLFDVQGRLLQTVLDSEKTTTLNISNQANGVYFLKVTTEIGTSVEKIIKE